MDYCIDWRYNMTDTTLDLEGLGKIDTIKYYDYTGALRELSPSDILSYDKDNLPYETQAITYYNILQLAEKLNLDLNNAKLTLEQVDSSLYLTYLNSADLITLNGNKKPTESMLQHAIANDTNHIDKAKEVNRAQARYRLVNGLVRAFEQRKDMIQSFSAKQRAEIAIGSNSAYDTNPSFGNSPIQSQY